MNTQTKTRILVFSTAYLPLLGGAEVAVKNITDQASEFEFDLVTARIDKNLPRSEKIGNINVHRVGWGQTFDKLLLPLLGLFKAISLHKKGRYKVIWSIMASYGGFAALAFKVLHPKVRFLLTLQEGDDLAYIKERVGIFYFLFKQIIKRADQIQTISEYLADWAREIGATRPIETIPNGVDLLLFKEGWSVGNLQKKIIITVSRLVEKNGIRDLISAMAAVEGELWIIGDGPQKAELIKLAKDLRVADRVKFLGSIDIQNVPAYLHQASIFVRPSLSEGLGNAFLEAMAVGLPVIGTPVGGIPEFLIDEQTGFFCKPDDPASIAGKIHFIFDQTNLSTVENVARAGQKLARNNYVWQDISQKMSRIFKRLSRSRILIATGIFPPDIGGPATIIAQLKKSLENEGHLVKVLTYSALKGKSQDDVHRVFKHRIFSKLWYLLDLFRLAWAADLVYATDTYSVGYFSYLTKKFLKKPYVLRFAGDSAWEISFSKGWIKDSLVDFQARNYGPKIASLKKRQRDILLGADKVIAVSDFNAKIAALIGVKAERLVTIHNSIDFEKDSPPATEIYEKYRVPEGAKIIMTACRLTPWKGIDGLIMALAELKNKFSDLFLMVLGDGPESAKLKALAQQAGVAERVIFTGIVPQEKMIGYLKLAKVFVLNTYYEGLSHTLLEAIKAGVPVIASDAGGNPEVIQHGFNGLLIPYNDREQLVQAIGLILKDEAKASAFIKSSRKVLEKYSWDQVIKATCQVIDELS